MINKMDKSNKHKIILLSILMFSLVLLGCSGSQVQRSETYVDLYTGTRGVELSFVSNAPPSQIFASPNAQLNFIVEVRNRGVYPTYGRIYLGGYDPNIIPIRDNVVDFGPIEGKTEYNLDGGYDTVEFEAYSINMPEGLDRLNQPFSLTAIYDYETVATALVCVDPNPYAPVQPTVKTCIPNTVQLSGGQGAPVAVSYIEVQSTGEKAFFKIHVANSGDGSVVVAGEQDPYEVRDDIERINKVYYDVTLSGLNGECKPGNPLRLTNEQGIIFCEFPIPADRNDPYQTSLKIRLSYGYINQIIRNVQLIKTPK